MLAMTWNVRGLGKAEKMRKVRSVILDQKPVVFFIPESKLGIFDCRVIKSIGGAALTGGVGVEAVGSVGGLITLRNEDVISVTDCISSSSCITVVGVLNKLGKEVAW
ncbi:hypothetical protein Ddye_024243 [Dipteronia dyeriana]|uniref:Uncharacterized protein n=1 Tax=Dipteronia dyeriana TaxID=168575 RepID=A0AAD9WU92_9ROSI|nr:hypothetical protein Ddye_024243 [Dipteronia dyeriana]